MGVIKMEDKNDLETEVVYLRTEIIRMYGTLGNIFILFALIIGFVGGYAFYNNMNSLLFVAIVLGFVLLSLAYYFIERHGDLKDRKHVDFYPAYKD